jgi:uncharacterized coiled-coil protein SlyX
MNTIETAALAELNAMIDAAQAKADALVAKLDALEKKITDREKRVAPYARKRKVSPVARRSAQPKNTMTATEQFAAKLEAAILSFPTFDQRMAAEGIWELLNEDVISVREARRQLAANGITLAA